MPGGTCPMSAGGFTVRSYESWVVVTWGRPYQQTDTTENITPHYFVDGR